MKTKNTIPALENVRVPGRASLLTGAPTIAHIEALGRNQQKIYDLLQCIANNIEASRGGTKSVLEQICDPELDFNDEDLPDF